MRMSVIGCWSLGYVEAPFVDDVPERIGLVATRGQSWVEIAAARICSTAAIARTTKVRSLAWPDRSAASPATRNVSPMLSAATAR